MEIKRDIYLKRLIARKGNGMIKVITGIRRSGKSYLLFNIFYRHLISEGVREDHIIRIALDDRMNASLRDPDALCSHIRARIKDSDMYYILLDEVQFVPEFEDVLNSFLHIPNADTYVTGSNARFLSKDIITEFRGRGDQIHIYPLSFAEFFSFSESSYEEALEEYMTYGGLPQVALTPDFSMKEEYLMALFSNVYLRDVIERNSLRDEREIDVLVDILASSIGSITNSTRISDTFRSVEKKAYTNKTIASHLEYLEDAFLISRADRFDVKGRRYIGAGSKYYFTDIGLRNARLNFRQQERSHMMENVIYNELRMRNYCVDVGVFDSVERNQSGTSVKKRLEVDFVVNRGSERYYIQSAYSMDDDAKRDQEFASLRRIPDSFRKIVIVNGSSRPWRNEEGFVIMGLKHFLLYPDSLEF